MFYSAQTAGFYDPAIHGANIPTDAVEITGEDHAALLAGEAAGQEIVADAHGRPVLRDPPPPTAEQVLAGAQTARAAAYRDEADPLFFKAQRGEAAIEEWQAKVDEIRARFPYPSE